MELHLILKLTKKEISLCKYQKLKNYYGKYLSDQITLEDKNVLI